MNYKDFDYPHSYLISTSSINLDNLTSYQETELFEYSLYSSDSYNVTILDKGSIKYLLLGYALDIRDSSRNDKDILEMLHKSKSIIEDLEYISGRYIYIKAVINEMYVYSDASQLLPMVFNKEAQIFSSHDNLLAEVLKDNGFNTTRRPLEVHNELDFTRYEEIKKFNPSMRLRTKDYSYRRIYPRSSLKSTSVDMVYNSLEVYISEMIKWLQKNKQPKFVTVTGGIDSRVSAALTRTIDDVEYLTYFMPSNYIKSELAKTIYSIDRNITTEMQENMKWKHSIVDLTKIPLSKEDINFYESFYNSKHGYRLDKYYREKKRYFKALHIKSTVFGMGKADFPSTLDAKSSELKYFKRSVHGIPKKFEKYYNLDKEIENYFERNLVDSTITKGRHYFDIFHLESRMGNWHSALTLETDPETEEFIFTNSRKIIDLIQLPTIAERRKFSLYKKIINNNWPVLLFFGINETGNLFEQTIDLMDAEYNGFLISRNRNLEIINKGKELIIQPKNSQITFKENFNFIIENLSKSSKEISIKSDYTKEDARDLIKVLLRHNSVFKEYDILDLNKGITLEVGASPISINILYNKQYNSISWKKAGKLIIE